MNEIYPIVREQNLLSLEKILEIAPLAISFIALALSYKNAKETWWKSFRLEIYPLDEGRIMSNVDFPLSVRFMLSTTFVNSGSKPGLISNIALVQLDPSLRMIEKIHLSFFVDREHSEWKGFNGLFLNAKQTVHADTVFDGDIQGSMIPAFEDWHLIYRLTSEKDYRLTDTIVTVDLKTRSKGFNLDKNGFYFADLIITHRKYFNKRIKDTMPEIVKARG